MTDSFPDRGLPKVDVVLSRRSLLRAGGLSAAAVYAVAVTGSGAHAAIAPSGATDITIADFSRDKTILDAGLGRADGPSGTEVALHGTTTAPDGSRIVCEIVDASDGAIVRPALAIATATGGVWAGRYPGVGRHPGWLRPRVRVDGSTQSAQTGNRFAAGLIVVFSGQSNEAYWENGASGSTGVVDHIADDDAVQLIYLHDRGNPTETDTGVVVGPQAITNASPHSEGVAASAALFTRVAPGLKVLIVGDAKGGVTQNATLDDSEDRRSFAKVQALAAAVRADGAEPGAFLIMHPNSLPDDSEPETAAYLYEAFTGRTWESDAPVTLPGRLGLDGGETLPADHVWPQVFPGLVDGRTRGIAMTSGYTRPDVAGVPTPLAPGADARSLLQQRRPSTFLSMGDSETTFNGLPPTHVNDSSHHTATLKGGIRNHGKMMAAMTLQAMGLTGTSQPRIDRITWASDAVRLSWSGGPLTNRASQQAPGTRPTYRSTGARIPMFVDEDGRLLKTEVRNSAGQPADQGIIWVRPNTTVFSGQSRIYHRKGVESEGQSVFMANRGPDFLLVGNQNMGDFVGLGARRVGYGTEYLNAGNNLTPIGDPVVVINNGPVRVSPNLPTGSKKLTLSIAASRSDTALTTLIQGSSANVFFWRVGISRDAVNLKFVDQLGTSFDGQVAGLTSRFKPVNHVQPRIRFVINTDPAGNGSQPGYVRLFVTPPGQAQLEITAASSGFTQTGSRFGVSQGGVVGNGSFRSNIGHRLFAASLTRVASVRAWLGVQADGGTSSLGNPWYSAVATNAGTFDSVNLVAG